MYTTSIRRSIAYVALPAAVWLLAPYFAQITVTWFTENSLVVRHLLTLYYIRKAYTTYVFFRPWLEATGWWQYNIHQLSYIKSLILQTATAS